MTFNIARISLWHTRVKTRIVMRENQWLLDDWTDFFHIRTKTSESLTICTLRELIGQYGVVIHVWISHLRAGWICSIKSWPPSWPYLFKPLQATDHWRCLPCSAKHLLLWEDLRIVIPSWYMILSLNLVAQMMKETVIHKYLHYQFE